MYGCQDKLAIIQHIECGHTNQAKQAFFTGRLTARSIVEENPNHHRVDMQGKSFMASWCHEVPLLSQRVVPKQLETSPSIASFFYFHFAGRTYIITPASLHVLLVEP